MLTEVGLTLGDLTGRKVAERYSKLEEALDYLFSWEKNFSLEVKNGKITSSGLCPIGRFCPKFCDEGCMEFIREVAKHFDAEVDRVSVEPCTFEFGKVNSS